MNRAVRSISAWLLALAMIVSGFSVFGSFGPASANAAVDQSKLVIKVTNQYDQPVKGAEFTFTMGNVTKPIGVASDENGVIETSTLDKDGWIDNMDLKLVSGSPYTMTSNITVSFTDNDDFQPIIEYVNDDEYTGEIAVKVNDPNAVDPGTQQPGNPSTAAVATADEVKGYMSDSDSSTVLMDARSVNAYNGWAIGNAKRGGHLKNAVSFPADAIRNAVTPNKKEGKTIEDYHKQMMDDAGITKDSKIIIYDVNDSDAEYVYNWLKDQGYSADNMKTFNGTDLINSGKAKVVKYKNYDMYVPEDVVKNISDNLTGKSDEYTRNAKQIVNGDDVVILDVSWGDETSDPNNGSGYDAGHIPGAVHVNTDEYETPKVYVKTKPENYRTEWRLNSDKELIQLAEKKGITLDSCVIIAGPEPMATTRMAVILKYLGVENVHVMSNAMTGWNAAGYSMEKGINTNKTTNMGITKPQNPDVIDTISEVKSELKNSKYAVIDTRTKAEWDGKDTGYGYHDLAGRIPGTIYSNCGYGYSSSVFRYRNADKSMRSGEAIKKMWKEDGIDYQNKHMVFFCGSGWRAAETTWEAWLMGYDASLYSDGWIGWSNGGYNYYRDGKTFAMDKKNGKEVNISAIKAATVSKVKAKAGKKKATVTYGKTTGVTTYKVYYKLKKKGAKYKLAKTTTSRKVTIKKLKSKKTYYVKVRAYKNINGTNVYTKYSKTVKVKAK